MVAPDSGKSRPTGRLARLSLVQKVPLVAAALIFLVGAGISVASYLEVRHTAIVAARQHVSDLVNVVGSGRQTAGQALVAGARRLSARAPITDLIADPNPQHRAAAIAFLREQAAQSQATSSTQVLDARGQLLATTDSTVDPHTGDFPATIPPGDSGSVGKLRLVHDSLVYPVAVLAADKSGAMLVQWRRMTTTAQSTRQTQQAIGAVMLVGNNDGSFWTDMNKVVAAPGAAMFNSKVPVEYTRDPKVGGVIGGFMRMAGTPWIFAVEVPMSSIEGPANDFLRSILGVTLLCVLLGGVAAWALARRVTTPLLQLTDAADALAGSEPTSALARGDEIHRLSTAFGAMTYQVLDARQRLEEKVTERTAELNEALLQLHDTQQTLVRRERLATLGQLAGGVGHELRNPLGVMSNAIYYLDAVLKPAPDNIREYLGLLREQVTLSSRIVSDLLDSARITPAQRRTVEVRTIVDTQVARLHKSDRVTIAVDICASLPAVEVDPMHVGQAMFNVLTNALQAIGDGGGEISISAHEAIAGEIAVRISDTGPGIPPDMLDRIFEPLFTTKARGIGLGLSVSRAMVQANGGNISVSSEVGRGATFTITMPVAESAPQ